MEKRVIPEGYAEFPEYVYQMSLPEIKFAIKQAQRASDFTLLNAKSIATNSYQLFTLISGILIGLMAFILGRWKEYHSLDSFIITAIGTTFYFMCIGFFFVANAINQNIYYMPGTAPSDLIRIREMNEENPDSRILESYRGALLALEGEIAYNISVNDKRAKMYTMGFKAICLSPIVILSIFAIASICLNG